MTRSRRPLISTIAKTAAAGAVVSLLAACPQTITPLEEFLANSVPPAIGPLTFPAKPTAPAAGLKPFDSEADLKAYVAELEAEYKKRAQGRRARGAKASASAEPAAAPSLSESEESDKDGSGEDGITNNQESGVDEGGIIKVHGDHLVVLRRGRLFTVAIGGGELSSVAMADTFPAGTKPDAWYDEMLVHDDTVVVIGYSYRKQATEIGLFDISRAGDISHRDTYYLRSNDYYSSRNYASRLLGDKLVFYMPYRMLQTRYKDGQASFDTSFPALQRHQSGHDDWHDVISATKIYRPLQRASWPVLHTVVTCDLSQPQLSCDAEAVLGPYSRSFYVSSNAVYVWVGGEPGQDRREPNKSAVYRLPLRGGKPGALQMWGAPTDQFSFKESGGNLHMLVRAQGRGDAMWAAEVSAGDVALVRAPLAAFAALDHEQVSYARLPKPTRGYPFQNRFVGDYVLYGTGKSWGMADQEHDRRLFIHPYKTAGATTTIELGHDVERIEALGRDAIVVGGSGKDLLFSSIALGPSPQLASRYTQKGAAQGETRSHGFFYKPMTRTSGVVGLPIRQGGEPGWAQLHRGSAKVLFLQVDRLNLNPVGTLASRSDGLNDHCVASCVDWYGNARPIFLRGRVFALLGYELVEGQLTGGQITEIARTNIFASARRRGA